MILTSNQGLPSLLLCGHDKKHLLECTLFNSIFNKNEVSEQKIAPNVSPTAHSWVIHLMDFCKGNVHNASDKIILAP